MDNIISELSLGEVVVSIVYLIWHSAKLIGFTVGAGLNF